ncbi:MAG: NAD(P)/FAD-dependent oxidoreductase, partial [Alphaproteobacteria bacterium]|nr:NAD(P)/FAD-dependent oxidoreductase [Alphaproteobacteria bacterium]
MVRTTRRAMLSLATVAAATSAGAPAVWAQSTRRRARVVIIGGGFGGGAAARMLRELAPDIMVTLIERRSRYVTCPFSNYVLAGTLDVARITHGFEALRRRGVKIIHAEARAIDPVRRTVRLETGASLAYDRLIVSPGVDIRWRAVDGYDEDAATVMPHAWTAGAQTLLLRRQLEAMRDGGLVILSAPANPFRCPPGPYERAAMIAHYLHRHKPRSKILILDAKDSFSKQGLFQDGWQARYPGMIEWVPLSRDGRVVRAVPAEMTLITEFGERHRGDVVNVIPPQWGGRIARDTGLVNASGWCPIDPRSFASTQLPDIHVIGDASIAGAMPKSGFSATSQGRVAAASVVAALTGRAAPEPVLV